MNSRISLEAGATILSNRGRMIVTALQPHGVMVSAGGEEVSYLSYTDLDLCEPSDDLQVVRHRSLLPWWDGLDQATRAEALERQAVVLELLTGFRSGIAALAEPGEPFHPFGDPEVSQRAKREAMSLRLESSSVPASSMTLHNWIRSWESEGLRGLVDGRRSKRAPSDFSRLDPRFRAMVEQEIATFTGTRSSVNASELRRNVWERMAKEGMPRSQVPQRLGDEYIRYIRARIGGTPRAHKSAQLRRRAGYRATPLLHPSHVCMDVTRADNLVWDPGSNRPVSVEIITVLSASTRVVLACRVVPKSATALEAGLAMYDAMRPFSMLVAGTSVSDWRWAGLPSALSIAVPTLHTNQDPCLQGHHWIPSVRPTSLRTDHGAIFTAEPFQRVLREFGVDFLPSRLGAPTDNSLVERWHETLQRGLQQIPGYKGRNAQQRGALAADEPLLTAPQLEAYLHRFIALDYHRTWHQGLVVPGLEEARVTPLEFFDIAMEATGRIDVPQHPDLIYQFLPVVWLTPRDAGVERMNLSYDGPALNEFRHLPEGAFRQGSNQMPFHFDPRDITHLWFRHPDTDRICEIRWRGTDLLDCPLTERMVAQATRILRNRGGNRALKRSTASQQIIDTLGSLWQASAGDSTRPADALRWSAAQRDHGEAAQAATLLPDAAIDPDLAYLDEPWPDYTDTTH